VSLFAASPADVPGGGINTYNTFTSSYTDIYIYIYIMASLQDAWAAPAACKLRTRIIPSCTMKKKRREFPMLENCGRPPFQKGQRAVTPYICCAGRRNMILCLIWAISLRGKEQRERSLLPSLRPGAGAVHGRAINIYIYFIILSSFLRNLVPTAARRRQTPRRFLGVVRPWRARASVTRLRPCLTSGRN
jgi:hypothetical protein